MLRGIRVENSRPINIPKVSKKLNWVVANSDSYLVPIVVVPPEKDLQTKLHLLDCFRTNDQDPIKEIKI